MPATTVEEWLDNDIADGAPHRCKRIVREWTTDDGAFVTCCADDGTQQTHHLVAMSSLSRRACYKVRGLAPNSLCEADFAVAPTFKLRYHPQNLSPLLQLFLHQNPGDANSYRIFSAGILVIS